MTDQLVSIVVPAHNEEGCLDELFHEVDTALQGCGTPYELILVNDGSNDNTAAVIDRLAAQHSTVRGIHLARNFGHQGALLAGLDVARGDAVVTIDADLEQPPSAIPEMIELWKQGYHVVHGVRRDHPETGWFKRTSSRWFYRVFSFLSRIPIEPGMLDFRLFDRRVVDAMAELPEADFFIRGVATWIGFDQARLPYEAGKRNAGITKYTTRKMFSFALRGITSFSTFPLRLGTYLGLAMTLCSLAYGAFVGLRHFFWENPQPGYASTILLISFLMGVQFLLIGMVGEYVGRIHVEVKRRPRFIVARTVGHPAERASGTTPSAKEGKAAPADSAFGQN